jgi:hypothetical protein
MRYLKLFLATMAAVLALSVISATSASAATHRSKANATGATTKVKKSTSKKSTTGTGAQLEVCNAAGNPSLDGNSFPFIEGTWSGSFYTSFSLAAEPSPGSCGTKYSFSPGSMVLVEEASSPGTPLPGVNVGFSVSNGTIAADLPNIDLVFVALNSGLTVLTATDTPNTPQLPGTLELCKTANDRFVQGSFSFDITEPGFSTTASVLAGQCNDISVPAGTATVTEQEQFPYALASVAALPRSSLLSTDLDSQSAQISIPSGGTSTAFFANSTLTGYVKVCKTLARSQDDVLAGQTFNFSVSASFDGATVTGIPSSVSVIASDYPATTCTFLENSKGLVALPLGTLVTVNETGLPATIQAVGTSISPANLNAGSTTTTAQLYVGNQPPPNNLYNLGSDSVTQATFTNEAYGYVEVCKVSSTINQGIPFQFSIAGVGAIPPVDVGYCGANELLPVGTATITEAPTAHVTLQSVTGTSGATQSGNSATVPVPYDNINIVTFDNEINTGTLKICKAETSSDAGLQGTAFDLTYSYVHNGDTVNGPVSALEPGQCTLPIDNVPVLNSNLTPVNILVTEETTSVPDIGLFNVDVVGPDTVVESPAPPTHLVSTPGGSAATLELNSLEGITDVTFVNGIDIVSG